jgi:DNA-binding NarL/FixJ family response regulator
MLPAVLVANRVPLMDALEMEVGEVPLVGRHADMERVERLLAGESRGVVIGGPGGVGKTRLAQEVLALAASRGFATAEVRGMPSTRELPLGALAPLLDDVDDRPQDLLTMLVRVRAAVNRLRQRGGLALFIDDAHLLDEASAVLTEQLVAQGEIFVIATIETGAPAPYPIVAVWKDGLAERLELQALDPSSMTDLAVAMLGGALDPGTGHQLVDLAGGKVRRLRELILAAREADVLHSIDGSWSLVGELPLPASLTAHVDTLLNPLPEMERDVVELVAAGRRVELAAVVALGNARSLETLERHATLTVDRDRRRTHVRLTDPLVSEVVRRRMPPIREREFKKLLGEWVLETGCHRPRDRLRAALWRLEGGVALGSGELMAAAREARDLGCLGVAKRLLGAAQKAGGGWEEALLEAELAWLSGNGEHADESLRRLASLATGESQRVAVALRRIEVLSVGLGRWTEALVVVADVSPRVTDPAMADRLALARAEVLLLAGRVTMCLDIAQALLSRQDKGLRARAAETVAHALVRSGHPGPALALLEGAGGEPTPITGVTTVTVLALAVSGRLREAEEVAVEKRLQAVDRRDRTGEGLLASELATVYLMQGRAYEAARLSRTAGGIARAASRHEDENFAAAQLVLALALTGDVDEARTVVERTDVGGGGRASSLMTRARAWVAVAEGQRDHALELLSDVAEKGAGTGDALTEALALYDLARLGSAEDGASRLLALSATTTAAFIDLAAMHVAGLADRDAGQLEQASRHLEVAGAWILAAEAAASAAATLDGRGVPRRVAALQRRASELAQLCAGTVTPGVRNLTTQLMLSARQLEIAGLAASGLSNRAIAERLFLSVRTVETQLQRIYGKLGVDGRTGLSYALGPSAHPERGR